MDIEENQRKLGVLEAAVEQMGARVRTLEHVVIAMARRADLTPAQVAEALTGRPLETDPGADDDLKWNSSAFVEEIREFLYGPRD